LVQEQQQQEQLADLGHPMDHQTDRHLAPGSHLLKLKIESIVGCPHLLSPHGLNELVDCGGCAAGVGPKSKNIDLKYICWSVDVPKLSRSSMLFLCFGGGG